LSEMSVRERYHAVMRREPGVRTLLWEFGYWAATVERWYLEGLRRSPYAPPPGFPAGAGVFGEGIPFPHQPGIWRYRDVDINRALGHDDGVVRIPLNWRMCPQFAETVLEETETTRLLVNVDGVKIRVKKASDSLPQELAWPVRDRPTWEQLKRERFGMQVLPRFPDRWQTVAATYRDHDYPVGLSMDGFFSMPRELLGVQNQLMMYYDDPQLMHDINDHLCTLWLAMLEEAVSKVNLDFVYFWEDMAFKNGPLMSPKAFKEFVVPYYKRITSFLHAHGIEITFVDTDGDCWLLIPGFLEAGVTGLYPFEVQAGMDIVEVRKKFPQLNIQGGLNKLQVAQGRDAIDAELSAKLPTMLSQGGYIPYIDHMVPPEISWDDFCYYRNRVREYVERYCPQ